MTNWKAMQVPEDKTVKSHPAPTGVKPRYLSMGSWHADASKKGVLRK